MQDATQESPTERADPRGEPDARERSAGVIRSGDHSEPAGSQAEHPDGLTLTVRGTTFEWGAKTVVMAILNLTPDSFSGDGIGERTDSVDAALHAAEIALAEGAQILDIGGESTRPGSRPVPPAEEIERVVPPIRAIRRRFPDAVISVDTSKAKVAAAALDAGADILNDVWALRADPKLAGVVASREVPVILMHNRSTPKSVAQDATVGGYYEDVSYAVGDVVEAVRTGLRASLDHAVRSGVRLERIILDPGIGFGKTPEQNLELLDRLSEVRALGAPILVGSSRKSFIGMTLNVPPDDRLEGTAATVAIAIARGADIVRVHDVRAMARVARMTDAIVRRV